MTTLRVACVGAGYFSQFHIDSWRRMARADLVGVCDIDASKAEATGVPAYTDVATMLSETTPDIVDVILPPAAQAQVIRQAIAHAPRAIICQKPFCASPHEARVIAGRAQVAGVPLVVHENFRFQPWYRAIKAAIDEGRIGELRQFTFRLRPGDGQGEDAYCDRQPYFRNMRRFLVHETGVHFLDTFRYLLGPASHIYADLRQENPVLKGEDAGYILTEHAGGARALFDANRCLDHAADNLRRTMGEGLIEGTDGVLTLRGDGSVSERRFGSGAESMLLPADGFDGFGGDCTHALQSHVVAGVLDESPIENLAQDYLTVLAMEEAAYASANSGRKIAL